MKQDLQPTERRRMRRLSPPFAGALALVLVLAPVGATPQSGANSGKWRHVEEVTRLLAEPDESEAVSELVALGADAAPAAWAVLTGMVTIEKELDSAVSRERVRAALSKWPSKQTTAELVAAVTSETPLPERLSLIELLAWTDSDDAVPSILRVFADVDDMQLRSRRVEPAVCSALRSLLFGHTQRFHDLVDELDEVPDGLLPAIVEAVAPLPHPEVVLVLARIANLDSTMERDVLAAIGEHGHRIAPGPTAECIDMARSHLADSDPRIRRLAIRAVGKLRDGDSFPILVGQLGDEDAVVRRVALEALQELSGMRRRWDAAAWQRWFEAEIAWIDGAEALVDDLVGDDAYKAGCAIRELTSHRLFGAEVAGLMSVGFESDDERLRTRVCSALGGLGHPSAVPYLIDALEEDSNEVRDAARGALIELTRIDLGEFQSAWSRWWDTLQ